MLFDTHPLLARWTATFRGGKGKTLLLFFLVLWWAAGVYALWAFFPEVWPFFLPPLAVLILVYVVL